MFSKLVIPSVSLLSTWDSSSALFIQESLGGLPRSARRGTHLALKPYQPTHSITNHQTCLASPPSTCHTCSPFATQPTPHNSPWSSTRQSGGSVPWP